ncbi:MAG: hypothetical protein NPIRA05_04170 [Nitrospirales bacterium]|nr:MAG: hypothetical protein NPIRA05_04170 [Nitrospirales bacterium]
MIIWSTILLGGCVEHSERWTAQGTTKLEHGAFHSLDTSVPIAKNSHLLSLREEKGERPEISDDIPPVVKDATAMEYSDIQILEQDSGQLLGLVRPELPNTMRGDLDALVTVGPQMPNVLVKDEPLSALWGNGETQQTEISEWYEISQVPFPGIEAIAVPGYSSEKEVADAPPELRTEQGDELVDKVKNGPIVSSDDVSVIQEHPEIHEEDKPSLPTITAKTVNDVQETTNETITQIPLPSLSVPTVPDDRLKPIGALQEKMFDQGPDLVKEPSARKPRSAPNEIMTEDVVVQKKSSLDRREKTGRLHSDEDKTLARFAVADKGKPSTAENGARTSNTISKLVLRKEPSESQVKKNRVPVETESMLAEEHKHGVNEQSKEKNDRVSSVLVEKEPGHALTENPLPGRSKPSTFVNGTDPSGRKKRNTMALAPDQRYQVCSQGHASVTRYQQQLTEFSRLIQIFLRTDHTTHDSRELHNCYRQRASLYFQLNDPTQAISDINRVLQVSQPGNLQRPNDLFFRGRVHASMNASQRVIHDVSEALQLGLAGTRKAHAYFLRGLSYFRLQQFDAGLKDLSLSCQDDFPEACALLEKIM